MRLTDKLTIAERIGRSAIRAARKDGSRRRLGQALLNFGTVILLQGRLKEAHGIYDQAEPILREARMYSELGTLYMNRGISHRKSGNHHEVIKCCVKAVRLYKKARNVDGIARAIGNLANGYLGLQRYKKALRIYEQALQFHRQTGDAQSISKQLGNMGIVHRHLKQFDEATKCLNQALDINREHKFEEAIAENLSNLGSVAEDRGELKQSILLHRSALLIEECIGDREGSAVDYESLGRLMLRTGRRAKAKFYLRRAILDFKSLPNAEKIRELASLLSEMDNAAV
jgi:tetratricopeptide (TPR) repeat protein